MKKKILQITPFYSPHIGGVETHLFQLNKQLVEDGYQVTVITTQHDRGLLLDDQVEEVRVIRLAVDEERLPADNDQSTFGSLINIFFGPVFNFFNKLNYKLVVWRKILRQVEVIQEADIVHVHDVMWWVLPLSPVLWHKLYITFHGWEGQFPVRWQAKRQRQFYNKMAKGVIHVGAWIEKFYGDKPDMVIYGGVSSELIKSKHRSNRKALSLLEIMSMIGIKLPKGSLKKPKLELNLVFLGRLSKENEIEKYISLIESEKKGNLKIQMTWVGDGPMRSRCERVGKVTGLVKNVDQYLQAADLVFASSYLSILEAQARGKMVCAFYSNQLKEQYLSSYPAGKYMVIAKEVSAMKKAILGLMINKELSGKMVDQAQRFAKAQTWQKVADEYKKLWKIK